MFKIKQYLGIAGIFFLALILSTSCTLRSVKRDLHYPEVTKDKAEFKQIHDIYDGLINTKFPTIKLHMKTGDCYIIEHFEVDSSQNHIICSGQFINQNRKLVSLGDFVVPVNNIALIETNKLSPNFNYALLGISTVMFIAFSIYCASNPKACFGSCPTLYAFDGDTMRLQSEAFSSSILPSLEDRDIDALYHAKPQSSIMELHLTNEAYETHVIRKADILALKKSQNSRVLADCFDEFYSVNNFIAPDAVIDPLGNTLGLLSDFDGKERFSLADSTNLTTKETIELTFNSIPENSLGLAIASRQSLMTTFLFYQTLAYMGTRAGEFLAKIENDTDSLRNKVIESGNLLGGIEIKLLRNNEWIKIGEIDEKGPIASDIKLIKLPDSLTLPLKIKLVQTKGYIRIDYVSLVSVEQKVEPITIKPYEIYSDDKINPSAMQSLIDSLHPLITMPGDKYRLLYQLPDDYMSYEYYVESKGYYLEWMREEWMKEENIALVYLYLTNPSMYYKYLTPIYKSLEPTMEESFWSSRYVR